MASPSTAIRDRVFAVAARREELLQKVAAAEHARPALSQLKIELAAIKNTFYESDVTWGHLEDVARKEKIDVDEIGGSHLKKFFHRSKYQEQVQKEEREYEEAREWADKAKITRDLLHSQVDEMKNRRDALETVAAEGTESQIALDELFGSVFDGPTPDVPEEDKLEAAVRDAQEALDTVQSRLSQFSSVVDNISKARASLVSALDRVAYAEQISSTDIVDHSTTHTAHSYDSFSSTTADWRERQALESVKKSLVEAEYYLVIAHRTDPDVKGFNTPYVANGDSVAGILDQYMNTPLTDYLFHREIEATAVGLQDALAIVREELQRATAKMEPIKAEADSAWESLKSSRRQLLDAREKMFEQVVSEGLGEAPPPYSPQS